MTGTTTTPAPTGHVSGRGRVEHVLCRDRGTIVNERRLGASEGMPAEPGPPPGGA